MGARSSSFDHVRLTRERKVDLAAAPATTTTTTTAAATTTTTTTTTSTTTITAATTTTTTSTNTNDNNDDDNGPALPNQASDQSDTQKPTFLIVGELLGVRK